MERPFSLPQTEGDRTQSVDLVRQSMPARVLHSVPSITVSQDSVVETSPSEPNTNVY